MNTLSREQDLTMQTTSNYTILVGMGHETVREALAVEAETGFDSAVGLYEEAFNYFKSSSFFSGYPSEEAYVDKDDQTKKNEKRDVVINESYLGLDAGVLLDYATCLAKLAQSSVCPDYKSILVPVDKSIMRSNKAADDGGTRWSFERAENFKRIASECVDASLEIIMGHERADRLTVAASKLAATAIEVNDTGAIFSHIERAKDAANRSHLSREVIDGLNEFRKTDIKPETRAEMAIEALDEFEEISGQFSLLRTS